MCVGAVGRSANTVPEGSLPSAFGLFQSASARGLLLVFVGKEIVEHVCEIHNLIVQSAINRRIAGLILNPDAILSIDLGDGNVGEGLHDWKLAMRIPV